MARVNPPDQDVPLSIREISEDLFDYLSEARFFDYQMWQRSGGGNDAINNVENITSSTSGANVAKLFQLERRIDELEQSNKEAVFNSKIAKLNQRIDELLDELLAELKLQRPNVELEEKKASLLQATVKQLELLNARTEEAFETTIDEEEI